MLKDIGQSMVNINRVVRVIAPKCGPNFIFVNDLNTFCANIDYPPKAALFATKRSPYAQDIEEYE